VPANLTPEYFKAEQWFREATTNEEKILALEQMLRVMPKHKGTDHLRADLRRKLSKLREAPAKKAGKRADMFHVPRSGAGQIVFLGLPNCGKSSIVALLTNAQVNIGDYAFATTTPVPGMMKYEDIQIQLVDMPPITEGSMMPGQVGTYRNSDLIAIVIDLSADVEHQWRVLMDFLESRRLLADQETGFRDEQGNVLGRPAFVIGTKCDIAGAAVVDRLRALVGGRFEVLVISTETMEGTEDLPEKFFRLLKIIRIYSKPPGKKADLTEPFTLPAGSTVMDLARAIHQQLAEKLKAARIWGAGVHPGQNVQRTHVLSDKDIVELHFG